MTGDWNDPPEWDEDEWSEVRPFLAEIERRDREARLDAEAGQAS